MATSWRTDVATWTTAAGAKTATLTTVAGDYLIAFTGHTGAAIILDHAVTDDQGGTWYRVTSFQTNTATLGHINVWVRTKLVVTGASTIVTSTPGGTSNGGGLNVFAVAGMLRPGVEGIRQVAWQGLKNAATPAPVFASAPLTENMIIGFMVSGDNPAAVTERANFTERQDTGYNVPAYGMESMTRNSGETSATQTWGGTTVSQFGAVVVELDASAPGFVEYPNPALNTRAPISARRGPIVLLRQAFNAVTAAAVDATVTPDLVAGTTAFNAVTVTADVDAVATPVDVIAGAATVDAHTSLWDVAVTPPLVVCTGDVPTITGIVAEVTVTVPLLEATAAVPAPEFVLWDVSPSPPLLEASSAVLAPELPVTVTPALTVGTATVPTPELPATVDPPLVAGSVTFPAVTVIAEVDATVTPAEVVGVAAVPAPELPAVVAPALIVGAADVPQATPESGGDATVDPPLITEPHTHIDTPTVLWDVTVDGALIASAAATPAVTAVLWDVTVTPPLIGDPHAHVDPPTAVMADVTVTPALIIATSDVPTPDLIVEVDATVAPTLVAGVVAVPTPTVIAGTDVTVTPNLTTVTATVPQATPMEGDDALVTPARIVGSAAVPDTDIYSAVTVTATAAGTINLYNTGAAFSRRTGTGTAKTWTAVQVSDMHCGSTWTDAQAKILARVEQLNPDIIFIAGDLTESGTAAQYTMFNTHWGHLKAKMVMTAGNHDWRSGSLTNWYAVAKDTLIPPSSATVPWRSGDINGYHIVCLNIAELLNGSYPYTSGTTQYKWLEQDLTDNSGKPIIAIWHSPRYSQDTGHGDKADVAGVWELLRTAKADVLANGHVHAAQRFAPHNGSGTATAGGPIELTTTGDYARPATGTSAASPADYASKNSTDQMVIFYTFTGTTWEWDFYRVADPSGYSFDGAHASPADTAIDIHNPIEGGSAEDQTVTVAKITGTSSVPQATIGTAPENVTVTPALIAKVNAAVIPTPVIVDDTSTVATPDQVIRGTAGVTVGVDLIIGGAVTALTVTGVAAVPVADIDEPPSTVDGDYIEGVGRVTVGETVLATVTVAPLPVTGTASIPDAVPAVIPPGTVFAQTVVGRAVIPAPVTGTGVTVTIAASGYTDVYADDYGHRGHIAGVAAVPVADVTELPTRPDRGLDSEVTFGFGVALDETIEIDDPHIIGTGGVAYGVEVITTGAVQGELVYGFAVVPQPDINPSTVVSPRDVIRGFAITFDVPLPDTVLPGTVAGTAQVFTPTLGTVSGVEGRSQVFNGENLDETIEIEGDNYHDPYDDSYGSRGPIAGFATVYAPDFGGTNLVGPVTITGAATADVGHPQDLVAPITVVGAATAVVTDEGTSVGFVGVVGAATSAVDNAVALAGAVDVVGTAEAVTASDRTGAGTIGVAGAAAAENVHDATAVGQVGVTGAVAISSVITHAGVGAGALSVAGAAAATVTSITVTSGTGAGAVGFAGAATGLVTDADAAVGLLGIVGAAAAQVDNADAAPGVVGVTGTGTAAVASDRTSAGTFGVAGSASALVLAADTLTATITLVGAGTAERAAKASARGPVAFTGAGAATASRDLPGAGAVGLAGAATGRVTRTAEAVGLIGVEGLADPDGYPTARPAGTITVTGVVSGRVRSARHTLEAHLWDQVKTLPGVRLFSVYTADPKVYRLVTMTVQIDARAASKRAARDRAWEAVRAILSTPDVPWEDGTVTGATVVMGPAWLPDENGAPRYVVRLSVQAHN